MSRQCFVSVSVSFFFRWHVSATLPQPFRMELAEIQRYPASGRAEVLHTMGKKMGPKLHDRHQVPVPYTGRLLRPGLLPAPTGKIL